MIISFSFLVGLTIAAPRVKKEPLVLLGSYDAYFKSDSIASLDFVDSAYIQTDKPAVFTVSIVAGSIDDYPTDACAFLHQVTPGSSWASEPVLSSSGRTLSMTVVGYAVGIAYTDGNTAGLDIWYCITVQGEADTTVLMSSPFQ